MTTKTVPKMNRSDKCWFVAGLAMIVMMFSPKVAWWEIGFYGAAVYFGCMLGVTIVAGLNRWERYVNSTDLTK